MKGADQTLLEAIEALDADAVRTALNRRSHQTDVLEWTPQRPVFTGIGR